MRRGGDPAPVEPMVTHCEVAGCSAPAPYGYDVSLLRGARGRWYCRAHRPAPRHDGVQDAAPAPRANGGQGRLL